VRRLLSFTLLLLFSLPLLMPLVALGQGPESQLAACCRRAGAHHCAMSAEQLALLDGGRHFTAPQSTCPMMPKAVAPAHRENAALAVAAMFYAGITSHPAQFHQVEAWARVALDGARQKRGPPSVCPS
jgi:hypothetical protein